jgi:hypothetical protein
VFSYELLGGVRLGFLVVSPLRIACESLQLLGAEARARPGQGVVPDHISYTRASGVVVAVEN